MRLCFSFILWYGIWISGRGLGVLSGKDMFSLSVEAPNPLSQETTGGSIIDNAGCGLFMASNASDIAAYQGLSQLRRMPLGEYMA